MLPIAAVAAASSTAMTQSRRSALACAAAFSHRRCRSSAISIFSCTGLTAGTGRGLDRSSRRSLAFDHPFACASSSH